MGRMGSSCTKKPRNICQWWEGWIAPARITWNYLPVVGRNEAPDRITWKYLPVVGIKNG